MQETKTCPYCGEEILASAKKCKHCGEWLEQDPSHSPEEQTDEMPMHAHVRKGIVNAQFNEENSGILSGEIVIIAIIVGVVQQSWWWFGGSLVGLLLLLAIPYVGSLLCIILSLAWGVIGYVIGINFISDNAAWVMGILATLAGLGIHFSGREWFKDLN